ncbi:hypothetical protein LWF15_31060 [Kineosporia rhizophila]|uniref:hypothetical protein n=1 Tax=Kineosporia TaxID=49184 RepID=UPI000A5A65A0|nr:MULTISPECIES: hypothetical protein [Kineosporia]MCE0539945.1 hypothetical protein [Kineosporia rhizophila]GLY17340.1 hypothetical protein Kisp01_43550 [Kineosporia sp. NBRC 101677]
MSPQLLRSFLFPAVAFVIALVLNLVLGNGVVVGLVLGLVAAVLSFGVDWLLNRGQNGTPPR